MHPPGRLNDGPAMVGCGSENENTEREVWGMKGTEIAGTSAM